MRVPALLGRLRRGSPDELASALAVVYREKVRARDAPALAAARALAPEPSRAKEPADDPSRRYRGLRRWAGWYEELVRIQGRLVDRYLAAPPRAATEPRAEPGYVPALGAHAQLDAELVGLLARAQRLVLKHPVAAQAAFAALVAEGRAFASTDEGARYDGALRRSPVFERASRVFDMVTGSALLETPGLVLPSSYVDLLVQAAAVRDLGPYFARLLAGRGGGD